MIAHGTIRICVPKWLARMPLVATVDGHVVPLDVPIPIVGESAEVCLRFVVTHDDAIVSAMAHCIVPIIDSAETLVGAYS